ncbi:MAG TPA: hypothetical protein IAA35_06735 [Candidatus Alistipes faecigallinarum]|nr:hypothetical protein [Candidatus Alistipes faecigallinarum]
MLAGVGCKDYDDDINKINDRLDELTTGKIADIESQISSMQTTIQNLQALETRIKALEDAQVTDADLQKLQDAIDAIEANYVTKDYLTTTLGSYATTQYVGNAIKAVTDALGKFTTDEAIQAAIDAAKQSAIEAAGKACEEAFKTAVESVIAGATEEPTSEIGKAFKEYDAHIKQLLTDAVEKEDGFINQAIAEQIKAAVDAMSAKLSGRLTSLQVVPDLYVNGIETIELKSFKYTAWNVTSSAAAETVKQGTATSTTAQDVTAVRYLVSPTTVTFEDIQEPSFVFEKAETRSAVKEQLLNVDSYSVKDGVLTVNVKKASGTEITLAKGYIYTAALGVPIAEKWLTDANKPEVVYSDFVALAETTVEPKIAALVNDKFVCKDPDGHNHYYESYEAAQAAAAVKQVAYDDKLDLLTLVTGCYVDATDGAVEIKKDELTAAGLEFRFALPTKPFVKGENDTDQQQFATIAGSTMTSKLPDGTTNNQAAIDKTPVVRVELVDVNNKDAVVDVRYFKIQWVRKTIAPIDLGVIYTFEYTLGCNEFQGKFLWNQMVNEVLAKIGDTGMSQDEFLATYTVPTISTVEKNTEEYYTHKLGTVATALADGVEFVYNFDDPFDESAAAFTWRLTVDQIGDVIDDLLADKEVKYVVNVTIPAQNSYQGSVNFAFEVKVALPELPEIYGYDSAFWFTDYTLAYVYPIQYNTPGALATCAYRYELDRLFADSKVVKNMLKCGKWDIQFAKTQPANGYASGAVTVPSADAAGHSLVKGMNTAVQLNYAAGTPWYAGVEAADKTYESAVSDIQVQVINNAEGIGILGQQATLDVWATINDKNTYKVTSFNVYFVEPLNINSELKDAYFVDQVISGSTIDCSKAFTMTDFKDYIVAKTTTGDSEKEKYAADLYIYYGVQAPVWDLANAKTNLKQENGNYVVDETITAETAKILAEDRFGVDCITANADNSTLTFKNVKGVKVEKAVKLFIPVTVKHKWGTLTETVTVDLLPEAPAAE